MHVSLRAAHILCTGVLLAGNIFGQPTEALVPWLVASVSTGGLMLIIDLHSSLIVLCEARGLMIFAKILLVVAALLLAEIRIGLLIAVVLIGGIGSHAPRGIRHRVLFLKRRLAAWPGKG